MRTRGSRRVLKIVQVTIGAVLIVLLFSHENRGLQAIEMVLDSSAQTIFTLVGLSLLMNWVSAAKWFLLSRARGIGVSLTRLTVLYLIGKFFSNFVPGMIGGDISRSYLFGRYIGSHSMATASIFLERFTGLLTLVVLAAIATLIQPNVLGSPAIGISIAVISAGCFVVLALLFVPDLRQILSQLAARILWVSKLLPTANRLFSEIAFFRRHPLTLVATIVLSCVFYLLASISLLVACQAVGLPAFYTEVAHATPVIYLATAVPVSPNNLGWWEWCVGLILTHSENALAEGIAVGLLIRAVTLFVSLIGGMLFLGYRQQDN
jgi:uncharacterized protein (TIRG00374 family)